MKTSGQTLYSKAKKIIPGGNQLLSKRPEMFHPKNWPSYFMKSSGIKIWDLDKNCYKDFSIMSVGQCPLGYANKKINNKIKKIIDLGNTSTLNSFEEVQLAKKLAKIHKGLDMVRFAKTGGEANSIAIRIARAFKNRSIVVASGYFGWQDWYLSANLKDPKSLNQLLIKGLKTNGIPKELAGTTIAVNNGDVEKLKKTFKKNGSKIAAIILEVQRNDKPNLKFIKEARKLCTKHKSVLIFDEISSGFRINLGGIYLNYKLKPDMVVLGKGLGNGFPISAVIGKKKFMQHAQTTFMSSSYWTDRIGFVAGNALIDEFKKNNVATYLKNIGKYFRLKFEKMRKRNGFKIFLGGVLSVPVINFNYGNKELLIKTIFIQKMLNRGFLTSNVIYLSQAHKKKDINEYIKCFEEVFIEINKNKKNLKKILDGKACHSGFQRIS
tara:strand:- start:7476 stop:8786 length:1311 start_codon:yes stop_codon:yes gene_type:complete